MFRSFRLRVTLGFGLLVLAVVAAVSWRLGGLLGDQLLRSRGAALLGIADGTAHLLADGLHERLRELALLADAADERRLAPGDPRWRGEIGRLATGRPHYAWIGVVDLGGRVRHASGDLLLGIDVSTRPWFRNGQQAPYVGDVHTAKLLAKLLPAPAGGEPLRFIDFVAPLHGTDGIFHGEIAVHADWRWAQQVIDDMRHDTEREQGVLVYILARDGTVIHRPAGADTAAPPASLPAVPGIVTWTDGRDYLTGAMPVHARSPATDLGWTVVVREPAEAALAGVHAMRRTVLAGGLLVAIAAVGLAWVVAGHFSRPLARMTRVAEHIGNGRFDEPIPLLAHSQELDRLSRGLHAMTTHLLARDKALTEANQRLEERVAERTVELERANALLEAQAHHDALTGLANRRAADRLLEAELSHHRRHGHRLGALLVDVDHFKRVNDGHGHAAGDAVLQAVAKALAGVLRTSDHAARVGGEEFLVLLRETDAAGLAAVAEKLRAAVEALVLPEVGRVTASVGTSLSQPDDAAAALLARADAALYAAKRVGRNRVVAAEAAHAAHA